tara:strand:- start:5402 stop:6088 length:687 start_codon:yes stop_codon:yes gene_type:complete
MATFTESSLIARARRRADMVNSLFVSDVEIRDYLNSSISELHDMMVKSYEDYFVTEQAYTIPLATGGESLPADFYKALGVDYESGGITSTLRAYSFTERNVYNTPFAVIDRLAQPMYKIEGTKIKLIPENSASGTITLFYVPVATQFSGVTDSVSLTNVIPGYEEYIVAATAIRMLMKEESDTSALELEKQQLGRRIIRAISPRDASGSHAIRDVRKGRFRDDFIIRY